MPKVDLYSPNVRAFSDGGQTNFFTQTSQEGDKFRVGTYENIGHHPTVTETSKWFKGDGGTVENWEDAESLLISYPAKQ